MIRLENVLKISLQDVLKMSWRHLEDVFKTSWRCLEDVLKTSWKRLEDVLKTYDQDEYIGLVQDVLDVLKKSSEDVWVRWIYLSWSRRLEDVLKTYSEVKDERRLQDAFKMSSSRRMFAGKSSKISIGTVMKNPLMLKFFPDHLKTKNTCKHAVKKKTFCNKICPWSFFLIWLL